VELPTNDAGVENVGLSRRWKHRRLETGDGAFSSLVVQQRG